MVDNVSAQAKQEHATTLQQFKILYRSKYMPLKADYEKCCDEIQRLREGKAAAMEANEKWRAQVEMLSATHWAQLTCSLYSPMSMKRQRPQLIIALMPTGGHSTAAAAEG
jgi:hypothetical protein